MIFEFSNPFKIDISADEIGFKAYNLFIMFQNGINTIPGIVIYDQMLEKDFIYLENKLSEEIKYSVRSSMPNEDTINSSSAGKYKTLLGVNKNELRDAVLQVAESAKDLPYKAKAVLIQPMIFSEVSGILFTQNPISGNSEIIIESTLGIGENCVSGNFNPDRFYYDSLKCKLFKKEINEKYITYLFCENPYPSKKYILNNIETRVMIANESEALNSVCFLDKNKPALNDNQILHLVKIGDKIEKIFRKPQDIEFAICNNKITILQSRTITTVPNESVKKNIDKVLNLKTKFSGIVASKGYFKGKVYKIKKDCFCDTSFSNACKVLVMKEFTPESVYNIDNFDAIVTELGGILCHAAIISRERKIPCVVNVDNIFEQVTDGQEIIVDANEGVVYI